MGFAGRGGRGGGGGGRLGKAGGRRSACLLRCCCCCWCQHSLRAPQPTTGLLQARLRSWKRPPRWPSGASQRAHADAEHGDRPASASHQGRAPLGEAGTMSRWCQRGLERPGHQIEKHRPRVTSTDCRCNPLAGISDSPTCAFAAAGSRCCAKSQTVPDRRISTAPRFVVRTKRIYWVRASHCPAVRPGRARAASCPLPAARLPRYAGAGRSKKAYVPALLPVHAVCSLAAHHAGGSRTNRIGHAPGVTVDQPCSHAL